MEDVQAATFSIVGVPGPKGSMRSFGKGRPMKNSSDIGIAWEQAVTVQAPRSPVCDPPYHVMLRFRLPAAKRPTVFYPSKVDLDKLARCTIDGLVKAGTLLDDRHVVFLTAYKRYAAPGEDSGVEVGVGQWQSSM